MKKFRFSLAALLQVRKQKEEIEHRNLLETHLARQRMVSLLDKLQRQFEDAREDLREMQKKNPYPAHLALLNEYLASLKQKISIQKLNVHQAELSVEMQRQKVIKAMQTRKIIENLKEKKFTEWENAIQESDRMTNDELSMMRYVRQNKDMGA